MEEKALDKKMSSRRKFSKDVLLNMLKSKNFWTKGVFRFFTYLLLAELAFVFIYPIMYILITSVMHIDDLMDISVKWIPHKIYLYNYINAFEKLDYLKHFVNSFSISAIATFGHLLVCSFVAYGFSRYKFPGGGIMFVLVMLSFVIPIQTIILPQYGLYSAINWTEAKSITTLFPLVVPTFVGFGLRGGLFIFIFRQFFLSLPKEMEEAARIDGCGPIKTYFRVILPMAGASLLVSGVLSMVWHWNDFYEPSIYISNFNFFTLPQKLNEIIKMAAELDPDTGELNPDFNKATVMAATSLVILPLFISYLFVQRLFIQGVERAGLVE